MGTIASQFTSLAIVYSIAYSDVDQRKHQSSASLAFVRGIHRGPVNSPRKWPVTRKMFPFDDVIMINIEIPNRFIWDWDVTEERNSLFSHDDVIKWKHFPRNWPFARIFETLSGPLWRHRNAVGCNYPCCDFNGGFGNYIPQFYENWNSLLRPKINAALVNLCQYITPLFDK